VGLNTSGKETSRGRSPTRVPTSHTSGKESLRGRSPTRLPTPQMGSAVRAVDPPLAAVARSDSHTASNPFGDISNK
jgi:hypothetical protein